MNHRRHRRGAEGIVVWGPRKKNAIAPPAPVERIAQSILLIRDQKVMLDADLADLYRVETKVFVQAVKRNMPRFPADFMFQLTKQEFDNLRSQFVTSSWGGRRYQSHQLWIPQWLSPWSRLTRSVTRMPIYASRKTGYIFVA